MKQINLQTELPEEYVQQLKKNKTKMDASYYDVLVQGDESVEVVKPDGTILFKVIRKTIPEPLCETAYEVFSKAYQRQSAAYRGIAAGDDPDPAASSVTLGALDRTARHGLKPCRETTFTLKYPGEFTKAVPYIGAVDATFREHMPRHWFYQRFAAAYTHKQWVIGETSFSSVAINQNFQTACHTDSGDLKGSFGVLACFKRGQFSGGELILPKYRVAVDFADGDVLLCNVHEVHGNAPLVGEGGKFNRLSAVFYFRERIMQCGTPEQEQALLDRRNVGDPLFGWLLEGGEFLT